jgi:hypothetical protein
VSQSQARQREQDLLAQLAAQVEAQQAVEKERDEARLSVSEGARQVQELKKKLTDVSSLLTGWKSDDAESSAPGSSRGAVLVVP